MVIGGIERVGLVIEPLSPHHDRKSFACGSAELDHWFRHRASREVQRGTMRMFVAVDDARDVVGFHSVTFITLALDGLPEECAGTLPQKDMIPAALIGRLARDERRRGQGIGTRLLADAIHRIMRAAKTLPVVAILAEIGTAPAATLHESFGFRRFPFNPGHSFLLTASVSAAMERGKP